MANEDLCRSCGSDFIGYAHVADSDISFARCLECGWQEEAD